jgi:hypothetical protein
MSEREKSAWRADVTAITTRGDRRSASLPPNQGLKARGATLTTMYPAGAAGLFVASKSTTSRATVVSQSPYNERNTAKKKRAAGPRGRFGDVQARTGLADVPNVDNPGVPSAGALRPASAATLTTFAERCTLV